MVYLLLKSFLNRNRVLEKFQSDFKILHIKESALLRVFNDTFQATEDGNYIVLLLDWSMAFNTVDHNLLPSKLEDLIGVKGTALNWLSQSKPVVLLTSQLVQNPAGQVLVGPCKRDPPAPILATLHWLSVNFRVHLRVFYLFLNL